jgi:hypothetical protein|tara:strand:- start:6614 stop:7081 length:468 start_codon:yes stop_codon:yes gene_type:complete
MPKAKIEQSLEKLKPRAMVIRKRGLARPWVADDAMNEMPLATVRRYGLEFGKNLAAICILERRLGKDLRWKITITSRLGWRGSSEEIEVMYEVARLFLTDQEMATVSFVPAPKPRFPRANVIYATFVPAPWDEEGVALMLGIERVAGKHDLTLLG